jgi:hypothetical protein
VLIDDSIVRGTTSLKIVQMMRDAGAARSAFARRQPADRHSCFYGVDTPERSKLLAAQMDVARMRDSSRPTASPSSRSTASTARSASPPATPPARNIATPASPATIRPADRSRASAEAERAAPFARQQGRLTP